MELEWYLSGRGRHRPAITIGRHAIFFNAHARALIGTHDRLDIGIAHDDEHTHNGFRFHERGQFPLHKDAGMWRTAKPRGLRPLRALQAAIEQRDDLLYIRLPLEHDERGVPHARRVPHQDCTNGSPQ